MKIAVIVRKLNTAGGAQRVILNVARCLQLMGHKVTLYTFFYDPNKCFPDLLVHFNVIELPHDRRRKTTGFLGFIFGENQMARSLSYLIDRNTDVLLPDDGAAYHVAYYYKRLIRNIPSVCNMNDLQTVRWPLKLLPLVENRAFHDIPWRPLWLKKLSMLGKTFYERKFIHAQDAIIVHDRFKQTMLRRYAHYDSVIIPSGVYDLFPLKSRKLPPGKTARLRILTSGIFLSHRRFEDTIEALAFLVQCGYDAELTILGDYASDRKYYEKLKELCENLHLCDRVTMWGRYSDVELGRFLRDSHVFIYPHMQSQGIAVYEAIASGLPTIVTALEGTYEALQDGKHLLFSPLRNPRALADTIERLVSDPILYEKLHREGAKHIRNNFSGNTQTREVLKLLQAAINKHKTTL